MKISFIGFGNIAKAMAQGFLTDKKNELRAAAPSLSLGITEDGIKTTSDNVAIVSDADIIILAVKPAKINEVFAEISAHLPPDCLVISVASGIRLAWFKQHNANIAVVRAMPNIAAAIGKSATPLVANSLVSAEQQSWAEQLFNRIGITTWVEQESDIDAFTALSGSGPAYVFLFMEAMMNAGMKLGLSEQVVKEFTLQTFAGALTLASEKDVLVAELRRKVTSPAGTTAAALEVFAKGGLSDLVEAAIIAAQSRAKALGSHKK
jgi:pyrroline-5-carboxylate reductase